MTTFTKVLASSPRGLTVVGADGRTYVVTGDRNLRNNNPGNIEAGSFANGMGAVGSDGRFAVFPDYATGQSAQQHLQFNTPSYAGKTIEQAINQYAPPSENNSAGYAAGVARAVGVPVTTPLSSLTPAQQQTYLRAQQNIEGSQPQVLHDSQGNVLPPLPRPSPIDPRSPGFTPVPLAPPSKSATGPFNYDGATVVPLPRPRPIGGDLNSLDVAANDPVAGVNAQLGAEPARPTGKTIPDPKFPNVPFSTAFPPANTMLGGASKQVPQSALQGAANGLSGVANGLASLGGGGTPPLPLPRPASGASANPANNAIQFVPPSSPSQSISPSNSSSFGDIFTSAPGPAIVGTDLNRQQAKQVLVDNPAFAAWAHNQKPIAASGSATGAVGANGFAGGAISIPKAIVPATPAPPRTILRTVPAPVYHTPAPAYAPQAPIQPLTPGNGYTYLPNGNGGYTKAGVTNPGLTPSQQYAVANGNPALTINSGPFASAGNNNDSARAQMGPGGSLTGI
jgi:hypothetical protein